MFVKPLPSTKEKAPPSEFYQLFPMFLVEQQGEEQRWEKLTGTQKFRIIGCEKIPTTVLTPIKTDAARSKNEVQDMCGSKLTLGIPQTPEPINSSSTIFQIKQTLICKCTTFSAAGLNPVLLLFAWKGPTRCLNTFSDGTVSDETS